MTTASHSHPAAAAPQLTLAGSFLEGLAVQDFARLGDVLAADARLRALLPSGLREWTGAQVIAGRFVGRFGDTEDLDLVEAIVGEVGGRPGRMAEPYPASTRQHPGGERRISSGLGLRQCLAQRACRLARRECRLSQDLLRAPHSRSFYTPGHMACGDSRASRAPHR